MGVTRRINLMQLSHYAAQVGVKEYVGTEITSASISFIEVIE